MSTFAFPKASREMLSYCFESPSSSPMEFRAIAENVSQKRPHSKEMLEGEENWKHHGWYEETSSLEWEDISLQAQVLPAGFRC